MTTITDDFNRANGALGANYTRARGSADSLSIASNACAAAPDNSDNIYFYTGASFGNDQEASIQVGDVATDTKYAGVVARGSGQDATVACYNVTTDGASGAGHTAIGRYSAGEWVELKGVSATFTSTERIGIRVTGSDPVVVSLLKNGNVIDSYNDSSGSLSSGGTIGVAGYSAGGSGGFLMDDFAGGDVASAGRLLNADGGLNGGMRAMTGGMQ